MRAHGGVVRGLLFVALAAGCGGEPTKPDSSVPARTDAFGVPLASPAALAAVETLGSRAPAAVDGFECSAGALVPRQLEPSMAVVRLPLTADAPFALADLRSTVNAWVRLSDARRVPAEVVGGYVVYPAAHDSGADLVHRPTANGTEDWLLIRDTETRSLIYEVQLGEAVAGLRLAIRTSGRKY